MHAIKLFKRSGSNNYYVRYIVPTALRDVVSGNPQKWKSTGTSDRQKAKSKAGALYSELQQEVAEEYRVAIESEQPKQTPEHLFEVVDELLGRDDLTEEQKSDILHDYREDFLKANEKLNAELALKTAINATAMLTSRGTYMPLSEAIKQHVADLEARGRNLSTIDRKEKVLTTFSDFAGNPNVAEVDRKLAGRWINEELKPKELTVATKEWHIGALKAAWTNFKLAGLTEVNPWERMNLLVQDSTKGVEKEQPERAWTQDELDKLKTVDLTDPIYAVSVIRLHSGIRVEEACCLRVKDVDLEENTFAIGGTTKNQSSQRTLPLHPVLQDLMPRLIENATEDGFLFDLKPSGKDKRRSHNFIKRIGRWVRANVTKDKGVTQYTLRHTYAQAMRDLRVDRETIEFTTGHKDQSMLFGTYARQVSVERLREAVEKLDFGF